VTCRERRRRRQFDAKERRRRRSESEAALAAAQRLWAGDATEGVYAVRVSDSAGEAVRLDEEFQLFWGVKP